LKIEDVFENNGLIKFDCGCKVAIAPEQVVRCKEHRPKYRPAIEEMNLGRDDKDVLICRDPGHRHTEECYQKRTK
jgi:hypothetical protein